MKRCIQLGLLIFSLNAFAYDSCDKVSLAKSNLGTSCQSTINKDARFTKVEKGIYFWTARKTYETKSALCLGYFEALEHCQSKGGRLPKIEELMAIEGHFGKVITNYFDDSLPAQPDCRQVVKNTFWTEPFSSAMSYLWNTKDRTYFSRYFQDYPHPFFCVYENQNPPQNF